MKTKYVYLVEGDGIFKIGYTTNPKSRYKNYKTHNPELKFLCYEEVYNKKIEEIMHLEISKRGYKKASQPEWFYGDALSIFEFRKLVKHYNKRLKLFIS